LNPSGGPIQPGAPSPPGGWISEVSIWQLVESGGYTADLPTWLDLAGGTRTGVLELGCGIGRVGHHLARSGVPSLGIDRDPDVVADFNRLSSWPGTSAVAGDAADPGLVPGPSDRIFAPQQLLQIIGGRDPRLDLLRGVAARLTPGGAACLAISPDLPSVEARLELLPDLREIDSWIFSSRPDRLETGPESVTVHRLRQRVSPEGDLTETAESTTLDRLDRPTLEAELSEAGLRVDRWIEIPPTDLHIGSAVAVARSV
jgi:SAM-dependent methyltransferase